MKLSRESMALLRLHLVEGMGPRRIQGLIDTFGSAAAAWREGPQGWREVLSLPQTVLEAAEKTDVPRVREEIRRLAQMGAWVVTWDDEEYPSLLREAPRAPAVLFGLGRLPRGVPLAVVGTRRPTPAGRRLAATLAGQLGASGMVIVSGMAAGIDAAAHEGCLEAGGQSVAVVAHGLDRCYPSSHRPLMRRIASQGAVITEFPLGTSPKPGLFPVRNRIVAGLSWGTLVVEAGLRSGAMITATLAAEMGREVFAVPGDVRLWTSKGPHQLLREGAGLVETAQDIWDYLAVSPPPEMEGFAFLSPPSAGDKLLPDRAGTPPPDAGKRAPGPRPGPPWGPSDWGNSGQEVDAFLWRRLAEGEWMSMDDLTGAGSPGVARSLAVLTRWELEGWVETDGHGRWRLRDSPWSRFTTG